MAYKSYLPDYFDTAHENIFFREIDRTLKEKYENKEGLHILIGNVAVQGHHLDAIFIKNGAIIVIDFKNYGGNLTFSENGPWRMTTTGGEVVFVSGGAASRNPFQQVRAYRFALFQYLDENKESIFLELRTNVKWEHTNCMVLFHKDIIFNQEQVPGSIQPYFHITDKTNFYNRLDDIVSQNLLLDDDEINRILELLHLDESSLYTVERAEKTEVEQQLTYDPDRMARIKQLIHKDSSEDPVKSVLGFYHTMIQIERIKESSVSKIINKKISSNSIINQSYALDLTTMGDFLNIWHANTTQNFPKSLFVSINAEMTFGEINKTVPLLYTTIIPSEITDKTAISLDFSEFQLFEKSLADIELSEGIIEELREKVGGQRDFLEKLSVISEILEVPLQFQNQISLGLSDETGYTLQLQAEYNNWLTNRVSLPDVGSVLHSFLTHKDILPPDGVQPLNFVQITQLNESQERAVKLPFYQPLTIITGPPGTGKSQVVMNIIANAVFNDQKVLFTSKNNKAVDNVLERMSDIFNSNYFLRLGSGEVNVNAIEVLNGFKNQMNGGIFKDRLEKAGNILPEFILLTNRKSELEGKLGKIQRLERKAIQLDEELSKGTSEYQEWVHSLKPKERELYVDENLIYSCSISSINERLRILNKKRGALGRFLFTLFQKKKTQKFIEDLNHSLSPELKEFVDKEAPYFLPEKHPAESFKEHLAFIVKESNRQKEIAKIKKNWNDKIAEIQERIEHNAIELNALRESEDAIRIELSEINEIFIDRSRKALLTKIDKKMSKMNPLMVSDFMDWLEQNGNTRGMDLTALGNTTRSFLDYFNAISLSNLTVKRSFVQEKDLFDLLVIDEASQNDIASALPLIYRAKRVAILGDPLQLTHITSVLDSEQDFLSDELEIDLMQHNYIKDSLFAKADKISLINRYRTAFLKEHYRCHPDIINFSNSHFYEPQAGQSLEIKTKAENFVFGDPGFNWIDVVGSVGKERNVNQEEVTKCRELALQLLNDYPEATIGVLTPFRHQKEELQRAFQNIQNEKLTIDTIHRFQGDERDIIILSTVVSGECKSSLARFMNFHARYLLNVAVTRARSALYVVGNKRYCSDSHDGFGHKTLIAKMADYHTLITQNTNVNN